jgi:phosphate transport system substrate-binding protein
VTRSFAFVLAALALVGCGDGKRRISLAQSVTTLTVDGSGALYPLLLEAANQFMRQTPHTVVLVTASREATAVKEVLAGDLSLAATNLPVTDPRLEARDVCEVALALVANRGPFNERVASLSRAQLRAVVEGRIDNWSALGGDDQPIIFIDRRASGERVALTEWLGLTDFALPNAEQGGAATVQSDLTTRLGALSFVALAYRHPALRVLALDGIEPSVETVRRATYPLRIRERIVFRKDAAVNTRAFVDFLRSPAVQEDLLDQLGYNTTDGGSARP